jgi:hypothetical protein
MYAHANHRSRFAQMGSVLPKEFVPTLDDDCVLPMLRDDKQMEVRPG